MKRNLITLGVAALIVAGIVVINTQFDPERRTEAQIEAAEETEEQLAQAEQAEQQLAQASDSGDSEPGLSVADVKDDDVIQVEFECSNGNFTMELYRDWAPLGVEQFLKAIEAGVYDEARFFRVVPGFVVQFGIPGDPQLAAKWRTNTIKDDPVEKPNVRGTVCFATSGPDSRTTQVFINLGDNRRLDGMGFAPFGKIVEGMDIVDGIESKYRENPNQAMIQRKGNEYLKGTFPDLDYIKNVRIVKGDDEA